MIKLSGLKTIIILLLVGASTTVFGFMGFGNSESWKEEVLLHDGSKIIVARSKIHKGRHEIGQKPPIKEHSITFTPSGSDKSITWKSEFTDDIGHANFFLLALNIINGTPYIATEPMGCIAYNKWGRPNPPYIFFKYENQQWKQIPLQEFPLEIKQPNVLLNTDMKKIEKEAQQSGFVPVASINKLNSEITREIYKTIIRTPLKPGALGVGCPELVRVKDGWISPDGGKAPIPIAPARLRDKNRP